MSAPAPTSAAYPDRTGQLWSYRDSLDSARQPRICLVFRRPYRDVFTSVFVHPIVWYHSRGTSPCLIESWVTEHELTRDPHWQRLGT